MEALLLFFLLCASPQLAPGISPPDVTYEDLEKLDATCNHLDSCMRQRVSDTLRKYTCNCDYFCSQLDTCCVDSPYRGEPVRGDKPSCKTLHGKDKSNYFMVDRCPHDKRIDDEWKTSCSGEWDYESLMSLVPVTSLSTNVTYKNYFCFQCHETGDKYKYWNVKLAANPESGAERGTTNIIPTYNKIDNTWMAPIGKRATSVPVTLSIEVPDDISAFPKLCVPNAISSCSKNWLDNTVRHKCNAYTSFVSFAKNDGTYEYKNPHCALCNFENLESMQCSTFTDTRSSPEKTHFSLTFLLNINEDKKEKVQKCDKNTVWDPYFEKCRTYKCAFPGHVVKDGKCARA